MKTTLALCLDTNREFLNSNLNTMKQVQATQNTTYILTHSSDFCFLSTTESFYLLRPPKNIQIKQEKQNILWSFSVIFYWSMHYLSFFLDMYLLLLRLHNLLSTKCLYIKFITIILLWVMLGGVNTFNKKFKFRFNLCKPFWVMSW